MMTSQSASTSVSSSDMYYLTYRSHVSFITIDCEMLHDTQIQEQDGAFIATSKIPQAFFNWILPAISESNKCVAKEVDAEKILKHYTNSQVIAFVPENPEFEQWHKSFSPIVDQKIYFTFTENAMVFDTQLNQLPSTTPVLPEGLALKKVETQEQMHLYYKTMHIGFETGYHETKVSFKQFPHPQVARFAIFKDEEPVAIACAYFPAEPELKDVCYIAEVATLPEYRRKGLSSILLGTCIEEAKRRGRRFATLSASPMGEFVYTKLGFQICGKTRFYFKLK